MFNLNYDCVDNFNTAHRDVAFFFSHNQKILLLFICIPANNLIASWLMLAVGQLSTNDMLYSSGCHCIPLQHDHTHYIKPPGGKTRKSPFGK